MKFKAFVFDMDGTILHTLPDLAVITNLALERMGFPLHTDHEVLTYVGNGAERLIEQAVPSWASPEQTAQTLALWRALYLERGNQLSEPFPGIPELLASLRAQGVKTAVLSNKFDAAVRQLAQDYFPGLFDIARGELPPTPRKPDPTALLQILESLGVDPSEAAYVGDTNVDVQVANRAGVFAIGVTWGYEDAIPMEREKLDALVDHPRQILALAAQA